MTKVQTWTMTALGTMALIVGILLATGAVGSAQTSSPTATPSEDDVPTATQSATEDATDDATDADDDRPHGGHFFAKGNAAEILGLTEDELRTALQSGQTLGDVAVAQGMTVDAFTADLKASTIADLDEKLAAGDITQERYDDIIADLDDHLDRIVNSTFQGRGHGHHGGFFAKGNAAAILGLTEEDLRTELQSGQTLAEIAVAQGMTVDAFTAELKVSIIADLDTKLAAGDITQERYDEITADLDARLSDIVNSTPGEGGFGHHGFRGGPPPTDDTSTSSIVPSTAGSGA